MPGVGSPCLSAHQAHNEADQRLRQIMDAGWHGGLACRKRERQRCLRTASKKQRAVGGGWAAAGRERTLGDSQLHKHPVSEQCCLMRPPKTHLERLQRDRTKWFCKLCSARAATGRLRDLGHCAIVSQEHAPRV
jgi:hypothetical protein